jgi:hypothetical protein
MVAIPNRLAPKIPKRINPAWAIDENARNLLIFVCLMANKLPIVMVISDIIQITSDHCFNKFLKTVKRTIVKINVAAPFEITDKYAVILTGAPS